MVANKIETEIAGIGPSAEDRKKLSQSFLGSLLGQSVALVALLVSYFSALALSYQYISEDLEGLRNQVGEIGFWLVLLAPLAFITVFSMIPAAVRSWHERQLRRITIEDAGRTAGHFRLHPYGPQDQDVYNRPDREDERAIAWLTNTDHSLLYFCGVSGAGKSSLLDAALIPHFVQEGWDTLTLRVYRDPEDSLRKALLDAPYLFTKSPTPNTSLKRLLEQAAEERVREGAKPLLIIIDQFEEFLILNDDKARAPLAEVLGALAATPLEGLHILLVFRSDYRELLFKQGLPDYIPQQNAFELAPFTRTEAEAFLRDGGRVLTSQAYNALFDGLDRIEGTKGIYRPITLNMIGLVLERMVGKIEGDPARLIDTYLRRCLSEGNSRDFAKAILDPMITVAGTKYPQRTADLVSVTGFKIWQVRNTLITLADQGLVRSLDPAMTEWEISHDFIARQIGQLLGKLRRGWLNRAAPIALPAAAIGWVALIFVGLPYWSQVTERRVFEELRIISVLVVHAVHGGLHLSLDQAVSFSDANLERLGQLAPNLRNLTSLDLSFADGITSLKPLKGMPLTSLDLSRADGITSLEPLKGMPLTSLDLSFADGITSLEPLKGMDQNFIEGGSFKLLRTMK